MAEARRGTGQRVLVTGASSGIGVDLAACFAADGYDLVLTARTRSALIEIADHLGKTHAVTVTPIAGDLCAAGGGRALASEIAALGLGIDVLVNNAGFGRVGAFSDSPISSQLEMIDLNNRSVVELTHIYWKDMLTRKRGGVLNVASTAAFQPGPLMAVYYASKAFVLSFSEALWEEARGTGVRVSCLCPGPTVSKFHERSGTERTRLARTLNMMPSMPVAQQGCQGFLADKRVVVTGASNKALVALSRLSPRQLLLKTVRRMQEPGPA